MVVSSSLLLTRGRGVASPELGDLVWLKEVQIGHVATPVRGMKGVVVLLAVVSEGGERWCTPRTTTLAMAPSSQGCSCRAEGLFCVQVGHEGVCCPSWQRQCLRSGYRPPGRMRKELCQLSATALVSMITTELAGSTSLVSLLVPRLQMDRGGTQDKGKGHRRVVAFLQIYPQVLVGRWLTAEARARTASPWRCKSPPGLTAGTRRSGAPRACFANISG